MSDPVWCVYGLYEEQAWQLEETENHEINVGQREYWARRNFACDWEEIPNVLKLNCDASDRKTAMTVKSPQTRHRQHFPSHLFA